MHFQSTFRLCDSLDSKQLIKNINKFNDQIGFFGNLTKSDNQFFGFCTSYL